MEDKMKTSKQKIAPATESKVRIPLTHELEVKDMSKPIVLRRIRLLQFGALFLILAVGGYYVWENFLRAPTGTELVNDMVAAAGGVEAWNNFQSGQLTRTRNLYDQSGDRLTQSIETYSFQKTPEGLKLMVHSADKSGNEVKIGQDKEGFWATKKGLPADPKKTSGDLGMMCDSKFCQPTCASSMMFYRASMPFKLTDNGVRPDVNTASALSSLDWNPLEFLSKSEKEPLVLDVSYKPTVGKDKWRFIVNSDSKLIEKVEYYNKSDFGTYRPEEIYWSDYKMVDGINFSHKWTRYWSNGQVMEENLFSNVDFSNPIQEEYFDRPEGLDWASTK